MEFFFDTADTKYIKNIWSKFQYSVNPDSALGITTNPNAFFKINALKLDEWIDKTKELCELTAQIRNDESGLVFVQFPSSLGSISELNKFINIFHKDFYGSKIGFKIPPSEKFLIFASNNRDIIWNVTGLSDAGTALKSLVYGVDWISLIPGRMESVGINFEDNLSFIQNFTLNFSESSRIITGSMRNIDGLVKCIQYGTVPTIGTTVFNLIDQEDKYKFVAESSNKKISLPSEMLCPTINEINKKLSEDFFKQMDDCGRQTYKDLSTSIN